MKTKNGVSFGLLSGVFWGLGLTVSAYIFSIFTDLSPFVVAAAHDFLSIFILLGYLLVKEGKVRFSIFLNIRNVSVIIGALLAGPIGMQANLYAVKYIGSSLASSVSAIYPAVSVLLAFFFLKHKISKNTVFGIFLIIACGAAINPTLHPVIACDFDNPLIRIVCSGINSANEVCL